MKHDVIEQAIDSLVETSGKTLKCIRAGRCEVIVGEAMSADVEVGNLFYVDEEDDLRYFGRLDIGGKGFYHDPGFSGRQVTPGVFRPDKMQFAVMKQYVGTEPEGDFWAYWEEVSSAATPTEAVVEEVERLTNEEFAKFLSTSPEDLDYLRWKELVTRSTETQYHEYQDQWDVDLMDMFTDQGDEDEAEYDVESAIDIGVGDFVDAGIYGKLWITGTHVIGDLWTSTDREDIRSGRGRGLRFRYVDAIQKGGKGPWYKVAWDNDEEAYRVTEIKQK